MLTDDIMAEIQLEGLGTIGIDLFVAELPKDIEGILINEYGGEKPTLFFNGGGMQEPKFQIFTRYNDYDVGRQKIEDIFNILKVKYYPLQTPGFLDVNESNQYEFSVNFKTKKSL